MEPVTAILAAIGTGIEISQAIITVIRNLKSTAFIIPNVSDQICQMTHRLKHLQHESQIRILSVNLIEAWLDYQETCNRPLTRIQELVLSYAKHSKSKLAIFESAKFQYLGSKDELHELLNSIRECNDYFSWLSENIQKAPRIEEIIIGGARGSASTALILSLGQHIQLMLREDVVKIF